MNVNAKYIFDIDLICLKKRVWKVICVDGYISETPKLQIWVLFLRHLFIFNILNKVLEQMHFCFLSEEPSLPEMYKVTTPASCICC